MAATQVKLFEDSDKQALEETVNKWLSENQDIEVLNVEFSSSQTTDAGGFDIDKHSRKTSIFFEPINVRTFVVNFGGSKIIQIK